MFTGIIEEIGTVREIRRGQNSCVLCIGCRTVLDGTAIGDSIALNGVCLTVTYAGKGYYTADVMSETMRRSGLGNLTPGDRVNLERAMPANGRFGGHIVSGHIDGTGTVQSVKPDDNAVWYTIAAPPEILRYVVEKGSIAVDGISLTVACTDEQCFKVSVIPHTRQVTALMDRRAGSTVNLECDIIGKYVEKLCSPFLQKKAPASPDAPESRITEEFLRQYGF